MTTATNQSQQPPATQPSGTDPVLLLVLAIVFVLALGATLYLCLAHPSLTGPIVCKHEFWPRRTSLGSRGGCNT